MNHLAFAGSVLSLLLTAALVRGILRRRAARFRPLTDRPARLGAEEIAEQMRARFAAGLLTGEFKEGTPYRGDYSALADERGILAITPHFQEEIEFPPPGTAQHGHPLPGFPGLAWRADEDYAAHPQPDGHP